ncbi:ureidoglycolate lyase [Ferrovibrio sp.]|uniref:ureidoglycolate lyase n=1 Tax=Ferrovibrio sp. TaxID=1917215 RepID=UPI0035166C7C
MSESVTLLPSRPLTAAAFAPYGQVIDHDGFEGRIYRGDLIENRRPQARLDLSFTLVAASSLPCPLKLFERHAFSAQAFIPLDVAGYLVTVCPDDGRGRPDPSQAVAFLARPDQSIVYAAGTWHHPMVALQRPGRFAIVMWMMGDAGDEELVPLTAPVTVG